MINGVLQGARMVEWGNFISAPFGGKVLAELGAEVIKGKLHTQVTIAGATGTGSVRDRMDRPTL